MTGNKTLSYDRLVSIEANVMAFFEVLNPPDTPLRLLLSTALRQDIPKFLCLVQKDLARNCKILALLCLLPFK